MRAALLITQALVFLPSWRWYLARLQDGSDEPWGVLALAVALLFAFVHGRALPVQRSGLYAAAGCTIAYAMLAGTISPLPLAALAVAALSFLLSALYFGTTLHLGLFGLAVLSLPIIASLQFFAGFPLRVLTSQCTAVLLSALGYPVRAEGTLLHYAGEIVSVDAPCAGIKMLWSALLAHFSLAAFGQLNMRATWFGYVLCSVAVFFANVLRASMLFFIEARIFSAPAWAHTAVGLVVFGGLLLTILHLHSRLQRRYRRVRSIRRSALRAFEPALCAPWAAALLALCILNLADRPETANATASADNVVWPSEFEGRALMQLPLEEKEQEFLEGFPGAVARFSDGERELLVRQVRRATRQLHPASDCLRAAGFQVTPLPLRLDAQQATWSCVRAERKGQRLRVCEQVRAESGEYFSDVSTWFWSAAFERSEGPWYALTLAEALES